MQQSLVLAASYGVASAVSVSLGKGLQKYGIEALGQLRQVPRSPQVAWKLFVWCLGTSGLAASALFLFSACAYGPVSLAAALSGTGLVALALFSRFVLGEHLGAQELGAIVLIVGGTALVGAATGPAELEATLQTLPLLLFSLAVLILALGLVLWGMTHKSALGLILGMVSGFCGGISVFYQKASMIHCACTDIFANISALPGNPSFFLFILGGVLDFLVTQFALARAPAIVVVPAYQSFYLLLPTLGGFLVYRETFHALHLPGLLAIVAGVIVLSSRLAHTQVASQ